MCSAEDPGLHNPLSQNPTQIRVWLLCRYDTRPVSCTVHFPRASWHVGYLSSLERQFPRLSLFRITSNFKEGFSVLYFCLLPSPTMQLKFVLCLNAVMTRAVILGRHDTHISGTCPFKFRHQGRLDHVSFTEYKFLNFRNEDDDKSMLLLRRN